MPVNERFSRQIALAGIGKSGQQALRNARVLICGMGGLGCPCAVYLAGMGIGTIGLCDGDLVQTSNLNRQFLYSEQDVQQSKVLIAAQKLQQQFPETEFIAHPFHLDRANAISLLQQYDFAADCLDTWDAKLLLNDTCIQLQIPFVHAGISEYFGQILPILPHKTACLRCLETHPDSSGSVLGASAGAVACIQATQLCRIITEQNCANSLFMLDTFTIESVSLHVEQKNGCICSNNKGE